MHSICIKTSAILKHIYWEAASFQDLMWKHNFHSRACALMRFFIGAVSASQGHNGHCLDKVFALVILCLAVLRFTVQCRILKEYDNELLYLCIYLYCILFNDHKQRPL